MQKANDDSPNEVTEDGIFISDKDETEIKCRIFDGFD